MNNADEASDVGEFKGHAGTIRVPSRGSAMSLVSRFGARNGQMGWPNGAFHLVHTKDRGSDYASKNGRSGYGVESFVGQVGERIGVVGTWG